MKRLWVVLLLFSFCGHAHASAKKVTQPVVGVIGPDFALPDTTGRLFRLDRCRGQIVVLNFWAFWCDTWKAEMPFLRQLAKQQNGLGFKLVAISVDGTRLPLYQKEIGPKGAPFPVLLDIGRSVSRSYHVSDVPTVVILGRDGHIRYTAHGYPGNEAILSQLRRISSLY